MRKSQRMPPASATMTEKREALEEVLQSATFFRAEQLRAFLRYICEMELAGRGDELCESLIGVEAFGRPAGYSPMEDASVRRRAGDLREKLQEVYEGELSDSKIRIELPKGKFVPRFVRVSPENRVDKELARIFRGEAPEPSSLRHANDHSAAVTLAARANTSVTAAPLEARLDEHTGAWRRRPGIFWFALGWVVGALMVAAGLYVYRGLHPAAPEAPVARVAAPERAAPVDTRTQAAPVPVPRKRPSVAPNVQNLSVTADQAPAMGDQSMGDLSYEAEAAGNTMHGITEPYPCNRCSGGKRVRNIGKMPRNYLVLNDVVVGTSGQYQMEIYYLLKGERSFFISVNDGPAVEAPLSGKGWTQVRTASISLTLKAGRNHIRFFNNQQYAPDLDRVVIRLP